MGTESQRKPLAQHKGSISRVLKHIPKGTVRPNHARQDKAKYKYYMYMFFQRCRKRFE